MKNIIIVGYPKSGSTWITRLAAELVDCPVTGFWKQENHPEIAVEGGERVSEFRCFKSHHQLSELGVTGDQRSNWIIYIIRDPRDVIVSAANYFKFHRYEYLVKIFRLIPKGLSIYDRTIYKLTSPESYRMDRMIKTILFRDEAVGDWFNVSWKAHFTPYKEHGYFFVRYEDMLKSPRDQCDRILAYLDMTRQPSLIAKAIENQSFDRKKRMFKRRGEKFQAAFLRSGKSGQWKTTMNDAQKAIISTNLSEDLRFFDYEI